MVRFSVERRDDDWLVLNESKYPRCELQRQIWKSTWNQPTQPALKRSQGSRSTLFKTLLRGAAVSTLVAVGSGVSLLVQTFAASVGAATSSWVSSAGVAAAATAIASQVIAVGAATTLVAVFATVRTGFAVGQSLMASAALSPHVATTASAMAISSACATGCAWAIATDTKHQSVAASSMTALVCVWVAIVAVPTAAGLGLLTARAAACSRPALTALRAAAMLAF